MSIRPHPTMAGWYIVDYYPNGRSGKRLRVPIEGYDQAVAYQDSVTSGDVKKKTTPPPHGYQLS